jgi:hypothetical protein
MNVSTGKVYRRLEALEKWLLSVQRKKNPPSDRSIDIVGRASNRTLAMLHRLDDGWAREYQEVSALLSSGSDKLSAEARDGGRKLNWAIQAIRNIKRGIVNAEERGGIQRIPGAVWATQLKEHMRTIGKWIYRPMSQGNPLEEHRRTVHLAIPILHSWVENQIRKGNITGNDVNKARLGTYLIDQGMGQYTTGSPAQMRAGAVKVRKGLAKLASVKQSLERA